MRLDYKGIDYKKIGIFWSGVVFLLLGGLSVQAAETKPLRIASWNVYNYVLMDRNVGGTYYRNYPKPEAEKQAMWEILKEVDPDILLLQEMGIAPFLLELQRDLKRNGLDYPYLLVAEGAPDRTRHLAVLSKIPWKEEEAHSQLSFKYLGTPVQVSRGTLELVFTGYAKPLILFNVHLKSRYTNRKEDPESQLRRRGEARVVRDLIFKKYKPEEEHWILIAGDFNDHPDSSPVRHFLQRGKVTLTERIDLKDPQGDRWTHYYAKQQSYSSVDNILASPALKPYLLTGEGHIYARQPYTAIASDHRLIWVDLKLPGAVEKN